MPPKATRKAKESAVDPATLRRSARGSAPTDPSNLPVTTSRVGTSEPSYFSKFLSAVLPTAEESLEEDSVFNDDNNDILSSGSTQAHLNGASLLETAAGPLPDANAPHFDINQAVENLLQGHSIYRAGAALTRSPSVLSIEDEQSSDTIEVSALFAVSSDDEPDADREEFDPRVTSTGGVPAFDTATLHISARIDSEESDSSASQEENSVVMPDEIVPVDPMVAIMLMMQNQQKAFMEQVEQQRRDDLNRLQKYEDRMNRQHDDDMKRQEAQDALLVALTEKISTGRRPVNANRSSARVPCFDLDKDKASFYTWKQKWEAHVVAHGFDQIENDYERLTRVRAEFTTAMSDHTLQWLTNQGFSEEQSADADQLIDALEAYIKGATNPLVATVELMTIKKSSEETVEHFVQRIKEKAKLCDLDKIADPSAYFPMVCLIAGHNDAETRKKLLVAKVKTFQEAADLCLLEERATKSSKAFTSGSSGHGNVAATSSYKHERNASSHRAQMQFSGGSSRVQPDQFRSSQQSRGGFRGGRGDQRGHGDQRGRGQEHHGQDRGRGGYRGQGNDHHRNQEHRGRSQSRDSFSNRSRSRSTAATCTACYSRSHVNGDEQCRIKTMECYSCHQIGHISPNCPRRQHAAQGASAQSYAVNAEVNPPPGEFAAQLGLNSIETLVNSLYPVQGSIAATHTVVCEFSSAQLKDMFRVHVPAPEFLDLIDVRLTDPSGLAYIIAVLPDTGANISAIPEGLFNASIEESNQTLSSADGTQLISRGVVKLIISVGGVSVVENVHIIVGLTKPIISRRALKGLFLIHDEFPNVSLHLAATNATTSKISLDPTELDRLLSDPTYELESTSTEVSPATTKSTSAPPIPPIESAPATTSKLSSLSIPLPESSTNSTKQPIVTRHGPILDELLNEFSDLFAGECTTMKDGVYKIELQPDAVPVNTGACRAVAEPYMPALKRELDLLQTQGIIKRIDYATEWLHPIVVVQKKGTTDIRLCVDFTRLNRYVKRPVNPQPTPWEVVRNLPKGTTHYAVFDALKGYHQIELDLESQNLTAFMTPFGRFVYLRLPFGLSSASDVFTLQYGAATDAATGGKRATEDTLLRGFTTEELVSNTRKFFNACRAARIALNLKKVQWDAPEVLFGGFLLTKNGYQLDPALSKALSQFPTPKNATDVRSFFGLANQLCNHSDDISRCLMPMKPLLKKGIKFQWLPEYQAAFERARDHLSSNKCLAYYDPRLPTRLVVDASRLNGLGFVLKQLQLDEEWKPVQAGSRFLTSAETRYAMIELEMLAIAWACAKARVFIDGLPRQQFEVWTDHAPLVPILEKQTLPEISNMRLQRLKMKVEHLTFKTVWIKGKENVEADALSRNPCANAEPEDEIDEVFNVASINMIAMSLPASSAITASTSDNESSIIATAYATVDAVNAEDFNPNRPHLEERLKELKKFCQDDPDYQAASTSAQTSWPGQLNDSATDEYRCYFNARQELYHDSDGFLCHRGNFVVPKALRRTYLERLLSMHQADKKMLKRARMSMWWPFMSRDIKVFAKRCESCEKVKPSQPAEPTIPHEEALYAFQFIHMDLAQWMGRFYLIIVDQHSSFPHLVECGKTATTKQVIEAVVKLISLFSCPEVIYSDGGPQFLENGEFSKFCAEWGIRHVTSSPYNPQSNGIAEAAVKQMKKVIKACTSTSGVFDAISAAAGLLMFRNTPRSPTDLSPAQIVFGHPIRDSLPLNRSNFVPTQRHQAEQRLADVHKFRNGPSRSPTKKGLSLLYPGQRIRIQDPISKRWDKVGCIINFGVNNREYLVKVDDGNTYRRNRHFLKPQDAETLPHLRQPAQAPDINAKCQPTPDTDTDDALEVANALPVQQSSNGPANRTRSKCLTTPIVNKQISSQDIPQLSMATPVHHAAQGNSLALHKRSRLPLCSQDEAFRIRDKKKPHQPIVPSPPVPNNHRLPSPPAQSLQPSVHPPGLSSRSSVPTHRHPQPPPRDLGSDFPPLPSSGWSSGPAITQPAVAGSGRPRRVSRQPVRFQAGT